jgi:energy-coupling factor transport system substrate-specific component
MVVEQQEITDSKLGGGEGTVPDVARISTPQRPGRISRASGAISASILVMTTLLGIWAFIYPFFIPQSRSEETASHAADAPLILFMVVVLCLGAIVADLETRAIDSKTVALLGVLVATNSLLRPVQGPGGSSFILVLPILGGYVFGPLFGFLLGALSILVSAIFTGGVGPWMPFQMLSLGWVGLSSALLPRTFMSTLWRGRAERCLLASWGALLGLLFGALMNLWFWPYVAIESSYQPEQVWQPGAGLGDAIQRYTAFYLATSLPYDFWRGVGNAAILIFLGPPILRLLRRYKQRFFFKITG